MEEKRINKRLHLKRSVIYGVTNPPNKIGFGKDISQEGLFITSRHILEVGTRLHFAIKNGFNKFLTAEGVVVRSDGRGCGIRKGDGYGLGIKFTAGHDDLRELTDSLIHNKEANSWS